MPGGILHIPIDNNYPRTLTVKSKHLTTKVTLAGTEQSVEIPVTYNFVGGKAVTVSDPQDYEMLRSLPWKVHGMPTTVLKEGYPAEKTSPLSPRAQATEIANLQAQLAQNDVAMKEMEEQLQKLMSKMGVSAGEDGESEGL